LSAPAWRSQTGQSGKPGQSGPPRQAGEQGKRKAGHRFIRWLASGSIHENSRYMAFTANHLLDLAQYSG
jgi:hypothetical protein